MRVHPAPKKRNITFRYDVSTALSAAEAVELGHQKKLRRLPHIFSKVLELPLAADADVAVHEGPDGFRFVAAADADGGLSGGAVRAHAVRIYPGVMKVVVRGGAAGVDDWDLDGLELNRWRFRLPPCTRPALAAADYIDGELVVTIPKGEGSDESDDDDDEEEDGGEAELWRREEKGDLRGNGGIGRLVVVQ
ncbi:uncharacterized protein LOC103716967 [Phoenix dactylifera]|uniref:Uncharacterized protein LOC103716967 n=1 Tax=Phoenix dactylifera TaxID=42345 RepID=A0A8B7CPA5_PHODC|nr:uncharacterized protein LOC103716967 [Phoenix dactylifera]